MKYYMTGATGFLSAYIVRDLVKEGHEVVATDLAPHPEFVADMVGDDAHMKQVTFERLDVTDLGAMILSMKRHKPQRVICTKGRNPWAWPSRPAGQKASSRQFTRPTIGRAIGVFSSLLTK